MSDAPPGRWERGGFTLFGESVAVMPSLATLAMGLAGGWVATQIGAPLPWLLGAVIVVGTAGLAGVRLLGGPIRFPVKLRFFFVPIIGVAIGAAFTPDLLREATGWWPTLLALLIYVPLAHGLSYLVFRHVAGQDRITAYFAAMPGGLIEAIEMGEKAGADARVLSLFQFARIIMCILIVPVAVMAYEGIAVGSAAGVQIENASPPALVDGVLLLSAAVGGALGARALHLPAAIITGPILASGAIHLTGLTDATPPAFLIVLTQLVVGCGLGVRFAGLERRAALRGLGHVFLSVAALLLFALAIGGVLSVFVGESAEAVLLAFAPGGLIEMSLIALSLEISVIFVTAHHVLRILWTVMAAQWIYTWLRRNRGWP